MTITYIHRHAHNTLLEPVSSLQLKHRWYMDVRCQQRSKGFAGSSWWTSLASLPSMVTILVHDFDGLVLHGCWGKRSSVYLNVTLGPSGLSAGLHSRMRKRDWRNERQLVAGLYFSTILFRWLSNLSPGCKFYVLFHDRCMFQGDSVWDGITQVFAIFNSGNSKELTVPLIINK